jgi:hypothetical protein
MQSNPYDIVGWDDQTEYHTETWSKSILIGNQSIRQTPTIHPLSNIIDYANHIDTQTIASTDLYAASIVYNTTTVDHKIPSDINIPHRTPVTKEKTIPTQMKLTEWITVGHLTMIWRYRQEIHPTQKLYKHNNAAKN